MTGQIPSHEITLALRRRQPEPACVLRRPEGCSHCWPCRKAAVERERVERWQQCWQRIQARLGLR